MKVYVVNFGWDYEGEDTRGVYSSVDKAREAIAAADLGYVDCVALYEIEIDAPMSGDKTKIE